MKYEIIFSHSFKRSLKRLKKRYRSVKNDVKIAIEILLQNPKLGVQIQNGFGIRKLRLKNSDLKKGKGGSYRLLYFIEEKEKIRMYLLLIYAKSDRAAISTKELRTLIEELL